MRIAPVAVLVAAFSITAAIAQNIDERWPRDRSVDQELRDQHDECADLDAYSDNRVSANTTYVYKVRAIDSGSNASAYSNNDLATTFFFTDDPLVTSSTVIKGGAPHRTAASHQFGSRGSGPITGFIHRFLSSGGRDQGDSHYGASRSARSGPKCSGRGRALPTRRLPQEAWSGRQNSPNCATA